MTTKRTPLNRAARVRLSPETLELFVRLEAMIEAGDHKEWEPVGRQAEYYELSRQLDVALGLRPWDESPVHVDDRPPQAWRKNAEQIGAYMKAQDLRRQILAAIEEAGA